MSLGNTCNSGINWRWYKSHETWFSRKVLSTRHTASVLKSSLFEVLSLLRGATSTTFVQPCVHPHVNTNMSAIVLWKAALSSHRTIVHCIIQKIPNTRSNLKECTSACHIIVKHILSETFFPMWADRLLTLPLYGYVWKFDLFWTYF